MSVPLTFILATPRHRRKRRESASAPPPPVARIVNAWLEDTQTLNVQFDQPVTVVEGANVGTWIVQDSVEGAIVPTELIQADVDVIWLLVSKDMTSGTAGYTAGNPGGLMSADGFPDSDEHSY